eukprot:6213853-Pleurochrysis_carterae.AAC.3
MILVRGMETTTIVHEKVYKRQRQRAARGTVVSCTSDSRTVHGVYRIHNSWLECCPRPQEIALVGGWRYMDNCKVMFMSIILLKLGIARTPEVAGAGPGTDCRDQYTSA